jgi:SAM-dependent methyltransferase
MMDIRECVEIYEQVPRGYFEWIVERMRPHLFSPVLEVGPGPGIVTRLLLDLGLEVTAADVDAAAVERLDGLFGGRPGFSAVRADVEKEALGSLPGAPFAAVVCVNVLEHLDDDAGALARLAAAVRPGGTLLVFVPAVPALYGSMDRMFGHRRRYTRASLARTLWAAGLEAEIVHFNLLGIPGWLWRFGILGRPRFSAWQNRVFGLMLPLMKRLESSVRIPAGLSLLAVARKR